MIFWSVALTVIPFLPASNLFLRVGFVVAERVLYIPSLGFCICVACGIISIYDGCPRFKSMVIGFTILLLVTFSAKTFQRNKVWSSREALFKSGIVALPHNAKVHYNYANFLKDSSLSDQAIKHYKRTLRLDPYHASAHNNVGTLMKNTTAAEYHYREALRISSRHAGAHVNLGNIYYQQGMLAEGITLLERALEIDPHHIEALFVLGGMMVSAGRWVEAERYLRSAIVEKPDFADAYNNYGAYLDRKGLTEDALVYYQQAYGLNSLHTVAMVNAARGLQELGKIDEAEDVLKRALLVNREVDTLDKLGQFYYQTGRLHEGLALYEEIEEMHPNHTSAMTHYGQLLTLVDEVGKAEIVLLRILNVNPSSIEALRQLSALYGKRGRHEEGLAHIKAALRAYHHQNSTDLRLLSAMLYEEGNHYKDLVRYGEAQSSFAASVSADPDNGLAHMNVGVLYHMNGDLDRAEFHYKKAEFLQNDSPVLKDNLQKLHTAKRKRNQSKNTQPGAR